LHRLDGPAIEYSDGDKEWYIEGKLHRLDGPADERSNGSKYWYVEGKLHREDGTRAWYIEGVRYTEEEFNKKINSKTIVIDGKEISISLESFEELKRSLK